MNLLNFRRVGSSSTLSNYKKKGNAKSQLESSCIFMTSGFLDPCPPILSTTVPLSLSTVDTVCHCGSRRGAFHCTSVFCALVNTDSIVLEYVVASGELCIVLEDGYLLQVLHSLYCLGLQHDDTCYWLVACFAGVEVIASCTTPHAKPVVHTANAVLITAPLGVLKSNSIVFNPPLPAWKAHAIQRMGFGNLNKVRLIFLQI